MSEQAMKSNQKGFFLIEALLFIQILVLVLFSSHVRIVKLWRDKISKLQNERIKYDGELLWENIKQ